MEDEELKLSKKKLFDLSSKAMSELVFECKLYLEIQDKQAFIDKTRKTIDTWYQAVLFNSKREKPVEEEK